MRAASCEAICSERADSRRAKCNSEMYCNICTLSPRSLTVPEACCNYYQFEVAIFATVFFGVIDIVLWVGSRGLVEIGQGFAELSHLSQSIPLLCCFDCVCDPT